MRSITESLLECVRLNVDLGSEIGNYHTVYVLICRVSQQNSSQIPFDSRSKE